MHVTWFNRDAMSSSKQSTLFSFGVKSKSSRKPSGDGDNDNEYKGEQRKKQKTEYEAKRTRLFLVSWQEEYPWVQYDKEKQTMFCQVSTSNDAFHKWIRDGTIVAYGVYDVYL